VKAIFAAAAVDDLAKFHAVVAPGFYLYDAGGAIGWGRDHDLDEGSTCEGQGV
jgi:hypothetical protein